ncbi:thioredoxin [Candidatus Oleimmundimicrobium sp.]|uniref:thioredoxin n=1 Tax=Candidatus Oleimmundimicrobium sp. TaxID=3060597 RepID=UPI00271C7262|nr:thioredoxin [Candidatus Oleimmundimicrobium sp.]MDO8885678.1 thioredoxin [Candidatus Oleimmundimicrobium sp.]
MGEKNVIHLSKDNFENEVIKAKEPVLVDFWASWCGPCRTIAPILEEIAIEYKNKLKVCKLNVDENQETAGKYEVMSIPTLILFESGEVKKRLVGSIPKKNLLEELSEWIK